MVEHLHVLLLAIAASNDTGLRPSAAREINRKHFPRERLNWLDKFGEGLVEENLQVHRQVRQKDVDYSWVA